MDFIAHPLTNITFTPSNISHTVSVEIVDNNVLEEREQFVVQFSLSGDSQRVDVSGPENATVTIMDNDSECPILQLCVLSFMLLLPGVTSHSLLSLQEAQ